MSSPSAARLCDLPVEVLHHIARKLCVPSLACLLRTSRFFYNVFCDEIYRIASLSRYSHLYLYRSADMGLAHGNMIALRRFFGDHASKAGLSVTVPSYKLLYGSVLQAMASIGDEAMVRLLIDDGADVNAQGGGTYGTALRAAASNGHEAVVRLLLDRGADVSAQDCVFNTALQEAVEREKEAVVRLLLDRGADPNACDEYSTVLENAAWNGLEEVVRLLLDRGADVNAQKQDVNGQPDTTALHHAARNGHEGVVRLLLDRGADINAQGQYGTALLEATENGHEAVVRLLLDRGADKNIQCGDQEVA